MLLAAYELKKRKKKEKNCTDRQKVSKTGHLQNESSVPLCLCLPKLVKRKKVIFGALRRSSFPVFHHQHHYWFGRRRRRWGEVVAAAFPVVLVSDWLRCVLSVSHSESLSMLSIPLSPLLFGCCKNNKFMKPLMKFMYKQRKRQMCCWQLFVWWNSCVVFLPPNLSSNLPLTNPFSFFITQCKNLMTKLHSSTSLFKTFLV